jgi:hypothetical protein
MSDWTKHVTKFYNEQKAGNPKYMFKQALKDAAKTYKKAAKPEPEPEAKPQKKNKRARTMKKRPRK